MWEKYSWSRLSGCSEDLSELGAATSAILLTAIAAERGLKTLFALDNPNAKPLEIHPLDKLFGKLKRSTQESVRVRFRELVTENSKHCDDDDIEKVFSIAAKAYVEWRYTMEPNDVSGGIPKGLLIAAMAVKDVGISELTQWQKRQREAEAAMASSTNAYG